MLSSPLKPLALTAGLGLAALTTAPTTAEAIEIYNCTTDHLPVAVSHVPTGRQYESMNIAPGRGASWNTGRGGGFRVSINVIGPDKRFSGRNGGETISIVTLAGNTELVAGHQCAQSSAATSPAPVQNNSSGLSAEEVLLITLFGALAGDAGRQ